MNATEIRETHTEMTQTERCISSLAKSRDTVFLIIFIVVHFIGWKLSEYSCAAYCVFAVIAFILFGCGIYAGRKKHPELSVPRFILKHCKFDVLFFIYLIAGIAFTWNM